MTFPSRKFIATVAAHINRFALAGFRHMYVLAVEIPFVETKQIQTHSVDLGT